MKTSDQIPKIYWELNKKFGVQWEDGLAITVGDIVYSKFRLNPDVAVHEMVHIEQQKKVGVEIWWKRYLAERDFRCNQEMEAYHMQASWIKANVGDRNKRFTMLTKICKDLAGPMYGFDISYEEICKIIRK